MTSEGPTVVMVETAMVEMLKLGVQRPKYAGEQDQRAALALCARASQPKASAPGNDDILELGTVHHVKTMQVLIRITLTRRFRCHIDCTGTFSMPVVLGEAMLLRTLTVPLFNMAQVVPGMAMGKYEHLERRYDVGSL
ncbi:hypothetical protein MPER_11073 [Moniliophthora perniciosa FA553]|nr:hypothetical protein MPER_11073 [Moniliophthora perniciosa FA553]